MTATLLTDLSDDDYHADPCATPSLSSSIANVLVDRTPLRAWTLHPKLGGEKREPTAALDKGSLTHKLLLGRGADVAIIAFDDFRKKAAQEERDAARAAGQIPVLEAVYEEALAVAEHLRKRIAEMGIEFRGVSEATILWQDGVEGGVIDCRARLDHLIESEGVIYDLKTTRDLDAGVAEKAVANYGYDTQHAAYTRAFEALQPELEGRVRYELIFVEPTLHGDVMLAALDGAFRERGRRRWTAACESWGRCLRENRWPGHGARRVTLSMPGWLLHQEGMA